MGSRWRRKIKRESVKITLTVVESWRLADYLEGESGYDNTIHFFSSWHQFWCEKSREEFSVRHWFIMLYLSWAWIKNTCKLMIILNCKIARHEISSWLMKIIIISADSNISKSKLFLLNISRDCYLYSGFHCQSSSWCKCIMNWILFGNIFEIRIKNWTAMIMSFGSLRKEKFYKRVMLWMFRKFTK